MFFYYPEIYKFKLQKNNPLMKTNNLIYWSTTILFAIFDGLVPALTSNTSMAIEGIKHLGYPDYFRVMLTVFKVLGALVLVIPMLKGRIKEWAYAGFSFSLIAATVSNTAVDGFGGTSFLPIIALVILAMSYFTYHKKKSISAI